MGRGNKKRNKTRKVGRPTIIHGPAALDAHDGGVDDDAAALGLLAHVVDGQRARVHDAL